MASDRELQFDAWLAVTGQTVRPDQPVQLPMLTGSMAPAIPIGAILRIEVAPDRHCHRGDVAVFRLGKELVAHRVLLTLGWGRRRWLLEKGDANPLGHWRSNATVGGRVVGFVATDGTVRPDPANPELARIGLRHHIRKWLVSLGGLRPDRTGEARDD